MTPSVTANGATIPAIGLGTWRLDGETCVRTVSAALDAGYRHVDTAAMYGNEREMGEAIRAHAVPRAEVFVTTKVWHDRLRFGELQRSAEESLRRLDVGPVDLLLIHWPSPDVTIEEQVRALCDAKKRGLARHVGVSNFPSRHLETALAAADEPLVTDQVEYHPGIDGSAVLGACRRHGLALTAYSPIARGGVLDRPAIRELADAKGKTPAQIVLRWHVQQPGVIAIPRSSRPERVRENIDLFDFELSAKEMARTFALARPDGRMANPSWAPEWDGERAA